MYKAVFLQYDYNENPATAKELKDYLKNSSKLLYGNDRKKTNNTPYKDKLHLIEHAFARFEELLTGDKFSKKQLLYIFDEKINEMHFFLKYTSHVVSHFILNEKIIDEMRKIESDYVNLNNYSKHLKDEIRLGNFFVNENIGERKFHRSIESHLKSVENFSIKLDAQIKLVENKAILIFKGGWQ